jgi:maltose O-acetyltransferase
MDSDFHDLDPKGRFGGGVVLMSDITIEDNVFVGNNVTILKGVTIGENSVVGNGSIVSNSIPKNVVAAGVPAVVLRSI